MNEFILPDIGEGIVECEIVKWLVDEGEVIKEDQAVVEVMTDKAVVEIPAKYSGIVAKLHYAVGDIAKVHAPLFAMEIDEEKDESVASLQSSKANIESNATQSSVSEDFILPDIGEGIVECEIIQWNVQEGDDIIEDQSVVEVMTDKAVVEIPAKHSGKVEKLYYQKGEIARVHTPLFSLLRNDELAATTEFHASAEQLNAEVTHNDKPIKNDESDSLIEAAPINGKVLASPAVRRIAKEQNVCLGDLKGSGKKGRVLKEDVEKFLADGSVQVKVPPSLSDRVEPIRGVKAIMAKQMQDSVSTIPHFTVCDEVVMDELISTRKKLREQFEEMGQKLSFMPFLVKALSLALSEFPIINSRVNTDCTELTYLVAHNIGIAVDSKIGLVVPNIKNVQHLSLFEVAQEVNRLVGAARDGKLSSSDLSGGTISVSNVGAIGGTVATPIINKPEVAIVALGKVQNLPRFSSSGEVVPTNIMQISWSGDHRVIDGATMVRFSNAWKSYLENPLSMLKSLR